MTAASLASEQVARRDEGVAWMNRGHALQQSGDKTHLAAAIHAYTQAIALLRNLPLAQNPSWANSLGAAWMNHGQLTYRAYGIDGVKSALNSFEQAAAVLSRLPLDDYPWARRNLAGTFLNRASLLIDIAHFAEAHAVAQAALPLAMPNERTELVDADLTLKIRRVLCDAIGQLLVIRDADQNALASEASDLVDDGLAVARQWAQQGEQALHPLAIRLFRYGAQLYRLHQPHFLAEFLLENLDPATAPEAFASDRELLAIAHENISAVLADNRRTPYLMVDDPASERWLGLCRELEAVQSRLAPLASLS